MGLGRVATSVERAVPFEGRENERRTHFGRCSAYSTYLVSMEAERKEKKEKEKTKRMRAGRRHGVRDAFAWRPSPATPLS